MVFCKKEQEKRLFIYFPYWLVLSGSVKNGVSTKTKLMHFTTYYVVPYRNTVVDFLVSYVDMNQLSCVLTEPGQPSEREF